MTNKAKKAGPLRQGRRRVQSRKGRTVGDKKIMSLANQLNDPCNATLESPEYGASSSGYMIRNTKTEAVSTTGLGFGYIVWYPDYSTGTVGNLNCLLYQTTSGTNSPTNSNTSPMGTGTDSAQPEGVTIGDPSIQWCANTIVQDSRTAAACLKFIYMGRNDELAGRVAILQNIPREALVTGGGSAPPRVDEMFSYATTVTRTPMDPLEVKFRPSEGSNYFRDALVDQDQCFVYEDGVSKTVVGPGSTGAGLGIGFAWQGVTPGADIAFDFVKITEWRPEMVSNVASVPPHILGDGGNTMSRAVAYLDKHMPGWQTQVVSAGKSVMARLASAAFSGPLNTAIKAAPMLLM